MENPNKSFCDVCYCRLCASSGNAEKPSFGDVFALWEGKDLNLSSSTGGSARIMT